MNPDVSIIILNYKSRGLTRECIKSFQRHPSRFTYEIIVVDNGGEKEAEKTLAERFPDVRIITLSKNVGFARGNNIGARTAHGRYLLFANQDLTCLKGSLDSLILYMEEHADVGLGAPRLLNPDGTLQQSFYRFYHPITPVYRRTFLGRTPAGKRHLDRFCMKDCDLTRPQDMDWVMGAALCVRRSAVEKVGLFDERFFFYLEDIDWCKRFWEAGWRVCYVPESTMVHLHGRDSAKRMGVLSLLNPMTRRHIISAVHYFVKHWKKGWERSAAMYTI